MDWQGHDLVVAESQEVPHDLSNSMDLEGDALLALKVLPHILSPLEHLPVLQLGLYELGQVLVLRSLLCFLADALADHLWFLANQRDDLGDPAGADPELLREV